MPCFVLGPTILFAVFYLAHVRASLPWAEMSAGAIAVVVFKTCVEIVASSYFFLYLFAAGAYWLTRDTPAAPPALRHTPPVGVIYLCCGDLDRAALESLAALEYRGKRLLIIHDDSTDPDARREVDETVDHLRRRALWEVLLLRRPVKGGGKSGAVNYVLDQTAHLYEYFLLCDNDSVALDRQAVERALARFEACPELAVVQCRTVGVDGEGVCPVNRHLARGIDAFHLFMRLYDRFGWSPFIGHNAFLRTRAVLEVEKFTLGFFSDDLDMTVRLNMQGYSVEYAPAILFGEKHPPSYAALRKRTYKWAYGCMQLLKAHAASVLTTRQLNAAEKLSFFQFAGFYAVQSLLLLYLMVTYLLAPLFMPVHGFGVAESLVIGGAIVGVLYLPVVAYFLKHRRVGEGVGCVSACAVTYGTLDFCSARATVDCLLNRKRQWVPTNLVIRGAGNLHLYLEAAFGLLLFAVPLAFFPPLLYLPCSYLIAGKFLFGVTVAELYDDCRHARRRTEAAPAPAPVLTWSSASAASLLLAFALVLGSPTPASAEPVRPVEVRAKELLVDGRPFFVRGIYYGPWRPGAGPNKGYAFPAPELIDSDMALIRQLNANTIVIYDPPGYVLDLAQKHGLKVLCTFSLNFYAFGAPEFATEREKVRARVSELKDKPALLGWIVGNEVPVYAIEQRGKEAIEQGLAELSREVKQLDDKHPVTHSNWPPTKDLNLEFVDFVSFNLYPLWPPEVVAQGYGNYIKNVLQPIAGGKPLLMTEFGVNRIEAGDEGQARLVKQCWHDLVAAGACGGVLFEFADQWWKNYDNPIRPGNWWHRTAAPDDEKQHDQDPEEHYGIVTADRQPLSAFGAVGEIFAAPASTSPADGFKARSRTVPAVGAALVVGVALAAWLWAKRRTVTV